MKKENNFGNILENVGNVV